MHKDNDLWYNNSIVSTQVLIKKLDKNVKGLRSDIQEMKNFLFASMKDKEGEYRGSFVAKILSRSQGKGPFYRFSGKSAFLKHVQK